MTTYSTKAIALAVLPKFSGVLSFLGSSYIFQDVLRSIIAERKSGTHRHFRHTGTKQQNRVKVGVYHRLVLGLSICDILGSIVMLVGTWAIPKIYADTGTYMASGTIGTCTAMGFINEIGNLGAPIYNASLCIHYFLVIVVGMSEEKITKKGIELYLHLAPATFAFVFAILGLVFKLYNGAGSWCWFASYPPQCTTESIDVLTGLPPTNPCTRGHSFKQFQIMHIIIAWVCLFICIASMLSIYRKVYKQEKSLAKYRHSQNKSQNGSKNQSHYPSNTNTSNQHQHRHYTNNNENRNSNNIESSNGNNYSIEKNSRDNNDSTANDNHGDTNKNHDDTNDDDKLQKVQFHPIDDDTSFTDHDHIMSTEFNNKNNIHNGTISIGIQKSSNTNHSSNNSNNNNATEKKKHFIQKMSSKNIANYYQSHRSTNASESNENCQSNNVGRRNKMKRHKKKSRQVADQGMFYVFALILTWLFPTITRALQWLNLKPHTSIRILFVIFFPLQGFFNALVYLRPKYLNYRKKQRKQKIQKETAEERKKNQINQRITSIFYNNQNAKRNEANFLKDNDDNVDKNEKKLIHK